MDADSLIGAQDSTSPPANPNMAGMAAARSKMQQDVNAEQKEMQPYVQKVKDVANSPHPEQPNLQKATAAPKAEDYSQNGQAFIGALSALSALVGARGRQRGTGALKAYAAGLEGVQKGNQQQFENAIKTWKADSDALAENNKIELEKYQSIMDDRKLTSTEASEAIKMVAAEHQDKLMLDAKDFDQQMKLYDIRIQQGFKYQEILEKGKEKADQIKEQLLTPEEVTYYANLKNTGDKASIAAATRGPAGMMNYNAITKKAAELNLSGGVTAEQQAAKDAAYVGQVSGQRSLGIQAKKLELASNLLDQSLPSMMEAAKKVGLSSSTDINKLYNTAKSHMSNEDFSDFRTQLRAVASDYAQFIGRGSGTVHSDEEALKILNDNMGEGGLEGFVKGVTTEKQNVQRGIDITEGKTPAAASSGKATHSYNPETGELEEH